MQIIKKDGTLEHYDEQKIINACNKAARRAMIELSDSDYQIICNAVWDKLVPESVKLIVFICQSTIRLAKSKKCTLIMLNQSA